MSRFVSLFQSYDHNERGNWWDMCCYVSSINDYVCVSGYLVATNISRIRTFDSLLMVIYLCWWLLARFCVKIGCFLLHCMLLYILMNYRLGLDAV